VTLGRKSAGLNYTRLSPFSSGPLTEAGPFLRLDGGTLDGIHIGTGFARDAPPRMNSSVSKRPWHEHPGGTAVPPKNFLLSMADPSASGIQRRPPILDLL
jgi:hypothetical protein